MSAGTTDLVLRSPAVWAAGAWTAAQVHARDGLVTAVLPYDAPLPAGAVVHELAPDEVLLPGLVDSHVHVNEPGRTHWEGFGTATRAALLAGVTTIVDMPLNSIPPTTTPEALAVKRAAAAAARHVDVAYWGGAVPENLGRLAPLAAAGVRGFKAFLAPSGVPEFGHLDGAGLQRALEEVAALGSVLVLHAEDPAHLVPAPDPAGRLGRSYAGFLASRPPRSERAAVEAVLDGVRRTGARAHVLHLSDAGALPALRRARAEGLPVTVETCPHYLALGAEEVPDGATWFKCCPPIRGRENADALWEGVLDGTIGAVVSDHSPAPLEDKVREGGDFGVSWGGIAGLQTAVAVAWTAARARGVTLAQLLPLVTTGPAAVAGVDAGEIRAGAPAHLVAFAPDEEWVVDATRLAHRHPVSPYDGATLAGRARDVWLHGVRRVASGEVVGDADGRDVLGPVAARERTGETP